MGSKWKDIRLKMENGEYDENCESSSVGRRFISVVGRYESISLEEEYVLGD